tara:strand:+ start:2088 stop:2483 length:396 start_codon:yes stop_codon:yes gene_type:complete
MSEPSEAHPYDLCSCLNALALTHAGNRFSDCHAPFVDEVGIDDSSGLFNGESNHADFNMVAVSIIDGGSSSGFSVDCTASDCVSSTFALIESVSNDSCFDGLVRCVINIEHDVNSASVASLDSGVLLAGHV